MHKRPFLALTLAGLVLAAPVAAFAQSAPAPAPSATVSGAAGEPHHQRGAMRRTLDGLGLSADQKTRIKEIMQAYRRSRETASPQTRQQLRAQIEGVLTSDQRTRFAAAMRQARSDNAGRQAPQPAPTS